MWSTIIITLIILSLVLWIWALVDILKTRFSSPILQVLLILMIFLFPVIGSLVYFQFKHRFTESERSFEPAFKPRN
ncbi:phospholipase D-like protein [Gramella sp. Hel_I_59]|uniref:PLDc N-terminal domain-containing protein n=1 Tax=Gramella sp. Hel_I_59 TaxID=1249978 RepID=UPI0011532C28|nr:PLDc N-terminal domain-containing protein [Gramella sp. Hel_I_59]TQI71307.1 phospholipase D-like protein [Gramella sp. Hel_I_59]